MPGKRNGCVARGSVRCCSAAGPQVRVIENVREAKRNRKREYLLAGHVCCGLCSARASDQHVKRETKQYHYCKLQCERLLDIYLAGKIALSVWDERNNDLHEKLDTLIQERARIEGKYRAQEISQEQIDDIQAFARQIAESINWASGNFSVRRRIIEMLNVDVALCVDDKRQKYLEASCILGATDLSVESRSIIRGVQQRPLKQVYPLSTLL